MGQHVKKKENLFLKLIKSLSRGIINIICFLIANPVIGIIVVVVLCSGLGFSTWHFHWFGFNTVETTYEGDVTIMNMIDLDQIYGSTDKYTGIVSKTNPKNKKEILYYASYEGTITAYIKTKDITIDRKDNEITLTLPELQNKYSVDMTSLDYMFKEGDEDEAITLETYQLAEKDIKNEASKDSAIKRIAKENLIKTLEALLKPLEDEGYTIKCK